MKNYYKYIGVFILLVLSTTSCEEFVDISPTDIIVSGPESINSVDAARAFMTGVYGLPTTVGFGELASDNVKLAPTNTGQGVQLHNWQYTETSTAIDPWTGLYATLNDINTLLSVIDSVPSTGATDDVVLARVKAEAFAARAYVHNVLMEYYAPTADIASSFGVPIITAPIAASQTPARNTVGEVYTQILSDIQSAYDLFPENDIFRNDRLSKPAMAALAARVHLKLDNNVDAMNWVGDAISLSGLSIATRAEYPSVWRAAGSDAGIILKALRTPTQYLGTFNRVTNADVFYYAGDEIVDLYSNDTFVPNPAQPTILEFADIRREFNFLDDGTGNVVSKYPYTNQGQAADDFNNIRIEEMYLIRAEAAANEGMLGQAADDINAIRQNRVMGYVNVVYANQADAIADVRLERRLELAFEGYRMFDLRRWGMGLNRVAADCLFVGCALPANDFRFTIPIDEREFFANPNMVQNPGY